MIYKRESILSIALICCLGIIVYSNTFHGSFHFDDSSSITDNFSIRNISDLQAIWNFWPCRFMAYLSFALNYSLNGLDAVGYHLFNLSVHLLTAILVWWLVLLTLSTPVLKKEPIAKHADLIALFAGLVFVSHPVQTQAVTYIVQRAASMATMFYLASLCFYIKGRLPCIDSREQLRVSVNPTFRGNDKNNAVIPAKAGIHNKINFYYIISLLFAILSMFTKEFTITLPLTIILYEFCFFVSFPRKRESITRKLYLSPFLLTIFIIPLTMFLTKSVDFQGMHRVTEEHSGISPLHYLLTEFRVMITYMRLLVLPLNQNLDYDYPVAQSLFELPTLTSFLFLVIVLFLAQRLFSKYRLISFSIFWFFLTLLPESSIVPIKDVIYEHRLYLPMVGYSIFLVSAVYYLFGTQTKPCHSRTLLSGIQTCLDPRHKLSGVTIVLTIIIGCNSFLTYQRNKIWKDEFTLWQDTVQKSPHKARPYSHMGTVYCEQGDLVQGILNYNKSLTLDPTDVQTYNDRGNAYAKQNDFTRALADFNKAIEMAPNFAEPYYNRGLVLGIQGNLTKSVADYTQAIALNPNYAGAYNNRAVDYYQLKEYDKAQDDLSKAESLGYPVNPNFINALKTFCHSRESGNP